MQDDVVGSDKMLGGRRNHQWGKKAMEIQKETHRAHVGGRGGR